MKALKLLAIIPTLILIIPQEIYALEDKDVQISIVTLTVPPACRLTITSPDVSKTTNNASFDAGYMEFDIGSPDLKVWSNSSWKLSARSTGFTGPYDKPATDLMLKDLGAKHVTNGFTGYKSLTNNDQEIASYNKGVKSETHPCQYKVLLDWEKDAPGTYSATVTYTLTTNAS